MKAKTLLCFGLIAALSFSLSAQTKVVIDKKNASPFNGGKFQGWGTNLCWWPNRIGYSDKLAQDAADLFFNPETGLGLNIVRYNIGGGDDPTHKHITRTDSDMPGFLVKKEDGTFEYDWNADHNQRNVLRRALKAGGDDMIVEAFSNSPPYFMTYSGCSSGHERSTENNLRDDQYEAFAEYMATVMENLQKLDGVKFQSCAPMNEPCTDYWGANSWKQEGCHFDAGESQSKMLLEMKKALKKHGLNDVLLVGTDETDIDVARYAYKRLSPDAKKALDRIDFHTYGGNGRAALKKLALKEKKNLWMSEIDGGDRLGELDEESVQMGAALFFAHLILRDMNGALSSAWIMWQAIDQHKSKDGRNGHEDWYQKDLQWGYWGLCIADHDEENIRLTKKYYSYAQFSKFIRPGSTIIATSPETLAAYDPSKKQAIIVAVNYKKANADYVFDLSSFKNVGKTVHVYRTSGHVETGENVKQLDDITTSGKTLVTSLLGNSITTFVIENVE